MPVGLEKIQRNKVFGIVHLCNGVSGHPLVQLLSTIAKMTLKDFAKDSSKIRLAGKVAITGGKHGVVFPCAIITVVNTALDPSPCYEHDTRLGVVSTIASVLFGSTAELRQSDYQKIIPLILQIAQLGVMKLPPSLFRTS